MIKRLLPLILITFIFVPCFVFAAKKVGVPAEPVLITSLGQNPDGLMVKVVLNKIGVKNNYIELTKGEELNDYHSIIMAVGVSYKGLGANGINFEYEVNRTKNLVGKALETDCPIILVLLGGSFGREKETNQLIELIAPHSSFVIMKKDRNKNKYITNLIHGKIIPIIVVDKLAQLESVFTNLYDLGKNDL